MSFVAVAERESFTGAAQKLATSVAQISRRVANLEERLAVKLLNRTTRKGFPNRSLANSIISNVSCWVEGLEIAELAVTQMQSTPKGFAQSDRAPVTYGERQLAPILHQFLKLHPQVELELMLTNQKLDLIDSGVDVAIRLGRLEDSSLVAKKLSQRQLYVCASPEYIERYGEPHTLSELSNHQCLVGGFEHWRFKENNRPRSVRVNGRIRCNSGLALLDAAKQSIGLVQLPEYYVSEDLDCGELVEVLSDYRDDKEGIWALYPQNRNLSSKVRLLVDFLSEQLD